MRNPRTLMNRAGVTGNPSRDQYFLIDERVLDRIPTYATDNDFDLSHILEIGPGTGGLTARLLEYGDTVTVIEQDVDLADFLGREFVTSIDEGAMSIICGDALEVSLPSFTTCISNLPYGISSPILFRLLPKRRPLILLVQQEFGERMAACPDSDNYGRLSVSTQHFANVELMETVPPTAFDPQPPVESVIVRVTPRIPEYDVPNDELFLDCVRAIFTQRRKTLRNAIRNTTHISGITDSSFVIDSLAEEVLQQRPGAITPDTFAHISRLAAESGVTQ